MKYSLSFTGYSFGAWLAEQSVYFSHRDFNCNEVRAVTFESPGSAEFIWGMANTNIKNKDALTKMFENYNLDIRTYLTTPNFLNTSNEHIGQVYRMFVAPLSKRLAEFDNYIRTNVIGKLPMKSTALKCYQEVAQYNFYMVGLFSLFSNNLDLILNEFDEKTGKLKGRIKEVVSWPKITFQPKRDKFTELLEGKYIIQMVPLYGNIIPKAILKFLKILFAKKVFGIIGQHLSAGVVLLINIIMEIFEGKLDDRQGLHYFKYNDNINECDPGVDEILDEFDFRLVYQAKYEIKDAMLREDVLVTFPKHINATNRIFHVDNLLFELFENEKFEESLIWAQFKRLKDSFSIEPLGFSGNDFRYLIKSKTTDIEMIRVRMIRLYKIELILRAKFSRQKNEWSGVKRVENEFESSTPTQK